MAGPHQHAPSSLHCARCGAALGAHSIVMRGRLHTHYSRVCAGCGNHNDNYRIRRDCSPVVQQALFRDVLEAVTKAAGANLSSSSDAIAS